MNLDKFNIRLIEKKDNVKIKQIIQSVLVEYDANKPGTAFYDPELDDMYNAYNNPKASYFIIENILTQEVLGGGGFGVLKGFPDVCELRKIFLLAHSRGLGLAKVLLNHLLIYAKNARYLKAYIETNNVFNEAIQLYQKFGFTPLDAPLGNTDHHFCDLWYLKHL